MSGAGSEGLGRSRGGFTSKLHLSADGRCRPLSLVITGDPDAVHARAKAAGAELTTDLHVTDYGSRDFAARDPEGNRWYFGTYRGEPR